MSKVTMEELLWWVDKESRWLLEYKSKKDRDLGIILKREWEIIENIRALISRADDVDRLVTVAKRIHKNHHPLWKEMEEALAPFMEKEK